ncbi:type IV secretion system protein [Bartonella tribocorum]|uniref:Type IV secretion protein VblB6 n=1 Tax=Bartonella tribocorum TaxID=85701 RepID=A0A2M6USQ4_9HYPH|nr:type IV secretion system protein [Bartonella tribocorum]PIT69219.1 type IV secretion protein VblB6 [Bartonella tribocorum]
MAAYDIFTMIDNGLMEPLTKVMDDTIRNLSSSLSTPLKASCTIYIIFIGYNIIYGRSSMPLWDFIATVFKLGIIVALATNATHYNTWVRNIFFNDLPNAIANVTQGAHSDKNVWDNMIQTAAGHVFDAANREHTFTFAVYWLAGLFCLGVSALFCGVGFFVSVYAKIGLFLVLSVGPLFISLYMFSATRRFTEAWLNQTVNFIILQVLIVIIGDLYVDLATTILSRSVLDMIIALVQFLGISSCGILIFYKLPEIASALASGGAALTGSTKAGVDAVKAPFKAMKKRMDKMEQKAMAVLGLIK